VDNAEAYPWHGFGARKFGRIEGKVEGVAADVTK
jgi:hypothetical protein